MRLFITVIMAFYLVSCGTTRTKEQLSDSKKVAALNEVSRAVASSFESSVYCSQEVNLKAFLFPIPFVKTMKLFGPAVGEGKTMGQARVALAKDISKYIEECKEDGYYSDIRSWCSKSKIECVGDITSNQDEE
ncbi:MAG: hypothetical protein PHY93_18190 [Bacteriovorax sp.]|nr:hypothetical protein [Bacteriovorax sp.]